MCGISGIFTTDGRSDDPEVARSVKEMTRLLTRRGPDDEGFWSDPNGQLHLGFRRLSILDTTPGGHQPMVSADGRSVIVFNGEIYNFPELRHELQQTGINFKSRSDTEVLIEALNLWGVAAIPRLNGMFAFAWYDARERTLVLARDHAGIKPLYYFVQPANRGIAFSSQFNALLHTHWGEPGPIREDVLRLFLRLHHIPAPFGLLENTYQLEPGHYLQIAPDGGVKKTAWWTLTSPTNAKLSGPEALESLATAIDDSVRRQRIADVPLGVFLSGGVDSPLVTAFARKQTNSELKAFTIGNPGWSQDEAGAAATYAQLLDVCHHIHSVTGEEALQTIDEVIAAQHEPFADFSIIPTLLISKFARNDVTVALSGDGGDELFFGYERPLSLLKGGNDFGKPWPLRMALYLAGKYGVGAKRSEVIAARTPGHYYFEVNSRLKDADLRRMAPDLKPLPTAFNLYASNGTRAPLQLANYSRRVEFYGQLQRGLKKVDMASMHRSLEVRVPLLDRQVIEQSLEIDPFDCMRSGNRKAILRDMLSRFVPAEAIPTPKLGFAVPLGDWLRGPLRDLSEDTLLNGDLYPSGTFDRQAVRAYWQEHLSGRHDHKWGLWSLLTLQWWAAKHLKVKTPAYA
ncbi:MAG: asparagine synthase (glutamine-hydrolyzing) [Pyrinomonadaceae bacterium]